jgi:hypothetical protein
MNGKCRRHMPQIGTLECHLQGQDTLRFVNGNEVDRGLLMLTVSGRGVGLGGVAHEVVDHREVGYDGEVLFHVSCEDQVDDELADLIVLRPACTAGSSAAFLHKNITKTLNHTH